MGEIDVRIVIQAPIEKVFRFIADLKTHPQYADFCKRIEYTSPERARVGATFRQVVHRMGHTHEVRSTVVQWEPPRRIVWVNDTPRGPRSMEISYDLAETPAGVEVVHRVRDLAMESSAAKREEIEENERELANLKRILEARPAAARG
jgi:uncharacterized protein YndB with AHSA1/START domain